MEWTLNGDWLKSTNLLQDVEGRLEEARSKAVELEEANELCIADVYVNLPFGVQLNDQLELQLLPTEVRWLEQQQQQSSKMDSQVGEKQHNSEVDAAAFREVCCAAASSLLCCCTSICTSLMINFDLAFVAGQEACTGSRAEG